MDENGPTRRRQMMGPTRYGNRSSAEVQPVWADIIIIIIYSI